MNMGINDKKSVRLERSSKLGRTFLIVLSALLAFAGPTYVVYVLVRILKINRTVSLISGLILFIAGLMLVRYMVNHEIVTLQST